MIRHCSKVVDLVAFYYTATTLSMKKSQAIKNTLRGLKPPLVAIQKQSPWDAKSNPKNSDRQQKKTSFKR